MTIHMKQQFSSFLLLTCLAASLLTSCKQPAANGGDATTSSQKCISPPDCGDHDIHFTTFACNGVNSNGIVKDTLRFNFDQCIGGEAMAADSIVIEFEFRDACAPGDLDYHSQLINTQFTCDESSRGWDMQNFTHHLNGSYYLCHFTLVAHNPPTDPTLTHAAGGGYLIVELAEVEEGGQPCPQATYISTFCYHNGTEVASHHP